MHRPSTGLLAGQRSLWMSRFGDSRGFRERNRGYRQNGSCVRKFRETRKLPPKMVISSQFLRQNVGKISTKMLNTSTRPSSISQTNKNFAPWLKPA